MIPQYIDTSVDGPKLRIADPRPIVMQDVEFIIISDKNLTQYLADIQSGKLGIIGMTPETYKAMSINTAQMLNYIKAQQNIIAAYREFYEPPKNGAAKLQ